jgi:hypothetical protein
MALLDMLHCQLTRDAFWENVTWWHRVSCTVLCMHQPRRPRPSQWHSTSAIKERDKLYNLDNPPWEICTKTDDALHVCATYPWASFALVFADGSAHWTALAPTIFSSVGISSVVPGKLACSTGFLKQEGPQCGVPLAGLTFEDISVIGTATYVGSVDVAVALRFTGSDMYLNDIIPAADFLIMRKLWFSFLFFCLLSILSSFTQ